MGSALDVAWRAAPDALSVRVRVTLTAGAAARLKTFSIAGDRAALDRLTQEAAA